MSGAAAVADRLLRVAARRWPADLRASMLEEWRAELAAVGDDPRLGPVARAVRQVRFAMSLAGSPPVEDEHGVPRGWRELLPRAGDVFRPLLMMLGAALGCRMLASGVPTLGSAILTRVRGYPSDLGPSWHAGTVDWAADAVTVLALAAAVGVAGWAGGYIGSRLPVSWAHRGRLGAAGSVAIAVPTVAAGLLAIDSAFSAQLDLGSDGGTVLIGQPLGPDVVWAVLFTPLAVVAVRLFGRGRSRQALLVAVLGGLAVLEVAAMVAGRHAATVEGLDFSTSPSWFPLTLLDPRGSGVRLGPVHQGDVASETVVALIATMLRSLLVATAFVTGYGLRAGRATASAGVPARAAALAGTVARPPSRRLFGLVAGGAGLVLWAYTVAILTPGPASAGIWDEALGQVAELHLWAQEIRESGILLAVLGLLVALAARGPVLVPGVVTAAGLLTADVMIDRAGLTGPRAFAGAFAVGVALLAMGWWISGAVATQGSDGAIADPEVRRRLAWVATVAALCAPALFARAGLTGSGASPGHPVASAAAAAMLAAVAGVAAVAARAGRLPSAVTIPAVGLPILVMAGIGALTGTGSGEPAYGVLLGVPFVAGICAIMAAHRRRGAAVRWAVTGVAAVVLAIPAMYAQLLAAALVGHSLIRAAGYGNPPDGLPFFPGAFIVAVALAVLIAVRTVPGVRSVARRVDPVVAVPSSLVEDPG